MIMQLRTRIEASGGQPDSGVALIVVLAVSTMLTLLLVATTSFALNQLRQSRSDQDWQGALAAAEGGVDEYLSHLNNDSSYYRWGNQSSLYTTGSTVNLPIGTSANTAFTAWTPLPGVTNSYFRYDVNTTSYLTTGVIKLRSSGKVGKRIRTVEVQIKRYSFGDYLYFTNYEEKDPATYSTSTDSYTPTQAQQYCGNKHAYEGRVDAVNGVKVGCTIISFGTGDQLNGPIRSNDAIYACGTAFFNGRVTTSYNPSSGNRWLSCGNGGGNPKFLYSNDPSYAPPLVLPTSVSSLKLQTNPNYASPVGCLYSGPTQIVLNSNGTMNVTSPWTINGGPAYCGVGNNLPLPINGVVYVENAPTPADVYTRSTPPTTGTCANDYGLGYPIANDITTYGCTNGDIFVEGTLSGQLTLAAENNIILTWNITYAGGASGNDLLGMVANNWVQIYHPVTMVGNSGSYQSLGIPSHGGATFTNPTIWGAILALQHSIMLQNWDKGSLLGNSNMNGAMGMNYRGVMGITGQSGTTKNYTYDSRLDYASPPHFINPVQSSFGAQLWSEITPAYTS
jgi:hypothetical protein